MKQEIIVSDKLRWRMVIVIFIAQSCLSASISSAFTLTAIIAVDMSANAAMAGIPSTLSQIGRALAALPIGLLMDAIGRRRSLTFAYMLAFAGAGISIYAILSTNLVIFLVGAMLLGMGRSGAEQGRYAAAELFEPARRARVIGIVVSAGTVGSVLGPLLVAPSESLFLSFGLEGYAGPFALSAILLAIAMIAVFIYLRPDPREIGALVQKEEEAKSGEVASTRPVGEILRQPRVILAIISMSLGYLVMVLVMVITPVHMNAHNHTTGGISFVIAFHTFGMFGLAWLTGLLIDRYGHLPLMLAGGLTLIGACIIAPISTGLPLISLALFLVGLGWNFCYVSGSSLLSDQLSSAERGRVQGTSDTLVAISSSIGSFGTGILFSIGGYALTSIVGMVVALVLVAAVLAYNPPWRYTPTPA